MPSLSLATLKVVSSRQLLHAVLLAVSSLRFLGLFCEAYACSFIIGFILPLSMLVTLASSCAWQLFILASVSLDRLGGAVNNDGVLDRQSVILLNPLPVPKAR